MKQKQKYCRECGENVLAVRLRPKIAAQDRVRQIILATGRVPNGNSVWSTLLQTIIGIVIIVVWLIVWIYALMIGVWVCTRCETWYLGPPKI